MFDCGVKDARAVFRQKRFIARDDDPAILNRPQNQRQGDGRISYQFHDDLDRWVVDHTLPVGRQHRRRHVEVPRFGRVFNGHFAKDQLEPESLHEQGTIGRQMFKNTCADIAQPGQSDANLLHERRELSPRPGRWESAIAQTPWR